ncbi:hypothetical protein [uncultured Desulfobacter sp.]|uniref:hypothetical protein n=1 Tax=uncultured Desulfobacter sp. TaxID=240139 RepID=UPI0029C6F74D|nr:hypothetical protein [uncultured Desulfobacter sp.]
MSFKRIINYLIVAICGSFSIYVKNIIENLAAHTQCELLFYPPLAALALYILLNVLFLLPYCFRFSRCLFKDEAKIEGDWIEEVNKANVKYYTFFSVKYNLKKDDYSISGIALTKEGEIHAYWDSVSLSFNPNQHELKYLHISKMPGKNDVLGLTRLTFLYPTKGLPNDGRGYFIDVDAERPIRADFSFKRVDKKMINKLLGIDKKKINSDDRVRFIKAYHENLEECSG